ncbi:hypothetical protein ACLKA6_012775 [Drosophila palustris]
MVWFQNSRAKDKKSRNQRQYAHISDDNNSFDGSSGKDAGNSNSNSINIKSLPLAQESMTASVSASGSVIEAEADQQLQYCQLCQMPQVNMQKHAFSVEHICKMKELIEQTSELYNQSNGSGSDDNDSDREKRFYSLSKALLLQHVVSSATTGMETPTGTYNPAETTSTIEAMTGATIGPGEVKAMSGDIDISVNGDNDDDDDDEMNEVRRKNSTGSRGLMQQLFNRNHITVIGGK